MPRTVATAGSASVSVVATCAGVLPRPRPKSR